MKDFFTSSENNIPISMKLMERTNKLEISKEKPVSYFEYSSIKNSNTFCFQSSKPISKMFIRKAINDEK